MLPPAKIALVHVAVRQLGLGEEDYRAVLSKAAGVTKASELDARGFDAVLDHLRRLGFVSAHRKRSYGARLGMATDGQVRLIRELWAEVSGNLPEPQLNAWLQHFGISALRFATKDKAAKVIAALKAWKARDETNR